MFYLDPSAIVKLVVQEEFSRELLEWAKPRGGTLLSSELARTELMRAVHRADASLMPDAMVVLDSIALILPAPLTFAAAGRVAPATVRSLDAIHIATALEIGDELEAFVAYDVRLLEAASNNGLTVMSPGQ